MVEKIGSRRGPFPAGHKGANAIHRLEARKATATPDIRDEVGIVEAVFPERGHAHAGFG